MNLFRFLNIALILTLFSCDSLKSVQLYETVIDQPDPYESFSYKDIFIDSYKSRVWGVKSNNCKQITYDSINNFVGKNHMHLVWNQSEECKYLGFGFAWGNFKGKNLAPILNNSAIQLMIRVDSGSYSKIPMFFSLVDYNEKQCFSRMNVLGIDGGVIDHKWRKVIIPLSTFKYQKKGVNISNIKELRIQLQRKGNVHIDDIKVVPHHHPFKIQKSNFTKTFENFPIALGDIKKYWWGVNENYSDNFKFQTSTSFVSDAKGKKMDSLTVLPEFEVSLSLAVNYDKNSDDNKWNNFGFPFNKWERADLSNIYSTSAIHFKVNGLSVPKMQLVLVSYKGKVKRLSKNIQTKNILKNSNNQHSIYLPIKSFKNFEDLDWSSLKELRFKILESSKCEIGDFKLVEFRGNPEKPIKWRGI
tara:strand:- start:1933 stop:3177 length:1245 start_codon:yes stop_codon:yes gene_type:complete